MNKYIKEMVDKSSVFVNTPLVNTEGTVVVDDWVKSFDIEKFAQLLIKDFTDYADAISTLHPRTDVAFDVGYTMAASRIARDVKAKYDPSNTIS